MIPTVWRDFEPGIVNELSTLFDPRYLDYRGADFDAVSALRERLGDRIPSKLEIGSNSGEFLEGLNQRSTADRPAIGIEHDGTQFNLSVKRRDKRKWQQAEVLRADARIAVPLLFTPGSLDEIHVHFPDPWWKDRHANRRLLEPLFLRILARRLRPGGQLFVKSDVFDYLLALRDYAAASGALVPLQPEFWPDERHWTYTRRERKSMQVALPFGRGYYARSASFEGALPEAVELAESFVVSEPGKAMELLRGRPLHDRIQRELQAASEQRKVDAED